MITNRYILDDKYIINKNTELLIKAINENDEIIINKFIDKIIEKMDFCPNTSIFDNTIYDLSELYLKTNNKFTKLFFLFSDEKYINDLNDNQFNNPIIKSLIILFDITENFFNFIRCCKLTKVKFNKILKNEKKYSKYLLLTKIYGSYYFYFNFNNKYKKIFYYYLNKLTYNDLQKYNYLDLINKYKQIYLNKKNNNNYKFNYIKSGSYVLKIVPIRHDKLKNIIFYIIKK